MRSFYRRRHDLALGIERIGLVFLRFPTIVSLLAILLAITAGFGIARIKIDDSLSQLFRSNIPEFCTSEKPVCSRQASEPALPLSVTAHSHFPIRTRLSIAPSLDKGTVDIMLSYELADHFGDVGRHGNLFNEIVAGEGKSFALCRICCDSYQFVLARKLLDAERPTAQALLKRDCRDSWASRCDAVRLRPRRRRTRRSPPPCRAASKALAGCTSTTLSARVHALRLMSRI